MRRFSVFFLYLINDIFHSLAAKKLFLKKLKLLFNNVSLILSV